MSVQLIAIRVGESYNNISSKADHEQKVLPSLFVAMLFHAIGSCIIRPPQIN